MLTNPLSGFSVPGFGGIYILSLCAESPWNIFSIIFSILIYMRCRFDPGVWKIPWRRKWQPTPIFLPGESHGQRSLAVYSPWGRKELGITERLTLSLSLSLTLRSALEFLHYPATELIIAGSCIKSTFCRTSRSIREMVCCYTIKEDDTSTQWFF